MKYKIKLVETKNGKIELTKKELEKMLNEVYQEGYNDSISITCTEAVSVTPGEEIRFRVGQGPIGSASTTTFTECEGENLKQFFNSGD